MVKLLDSNICIGFLKGDPQIRERLTSLAPGEAVLCSVVKAELLYGARNSARVSAGLRALEAFFRPFASYSFDDEAALIYGAIAAELRREGKLIGSNDMQIAAIAISTNATLVTRDVRDFERVPGLRFDTW